MGALEEAHLAAVAACGCDDEEDKEDLLAELGVGGGEAPGDAMEPAACALLAGLDEDDCREGLRRTPKRVAKAFHDGTAAAAAVAMPFTPGPYSAKSTLALVARVSAVGVGVVYGSVKLGILKCVIRHAICSACHGMLVNKDKCHVCSITGGYNRCIVLEQILESVQATCSNTKYGCAIKTHYHKHQTNVPICLTMYDSCISKLQILIEIELYKLRCKCNGVHILLFGL